VLPGTGHLSPLESPVEVAGIIREFVDGLERASSDAKQSGRLPAAT
jgi:hypothetical protein